MGERERERERERGGEQIRGGGEGEEKREGGGTEGGGGENCLVDSSRIIYCLFSILFISFFLSLSFSPSSLI